MSRVDVSESVLHWALDRSKLDEDKLQNKYPKIRQWLTGEIKPTLKQLEKLAKTTMTPLGFFFLKEPPIIRLPIPHFRTLGNEDMRQPSPNLIETVHIMQRRQAWMKEFLIEQGQEKHTYVNSARLDEKSTLIAQKIRATLGFDEEWASRCPNWTNALGILRKAMEDAGILVAVNGIVGNNTHRKLDPEEFRGFVLADEYAPLVFVNGADGKAAQMFTLAHELAHLFFGSSAAFDLREMQPANDSIERVCNQVAAEFLIPEKSLNNIWPSVMNNPEPFQTIAKKFKVSVLVAARRALDLDLINKQTFLEFYRGYLRDERRSAESQSGGGNFYANQNLRVGKLFTSVVVKAVSEGKLLYSEAFKLTGLSGKSFNQYVNRLKERGQI